MPDPLLVAAGVGAVGPLIAGPALACGIDRLPLHWRRGAIWLVVIAGVMLAIADDLTTAGPGGSGLLVYALAPLPGVITYLVSRSLLASALVSLAPMYIVIAIANKSGPTHRPELALDRLIVVQPEWMIVYGSLYVFIILLPLLVVRDFRLARSAMQAYLMVMLIAYAGFLLYPTTASRPLDVPGDGFAAWTLRLIYAIDPPYNCFPSLHVAYAFVSALTCFRVHRLVGRVALLWAGLICVSTLFTKQHYTVDVVAGVAMAGLAYLLFMRTYTRELVSTTEHDRAPRRALAAVGTYAVMVAGFWLAYRFSGGALGPD